MNPEVPMMVCDWCKKEFPADARACVEGGIDAQWLDDDDGEAWKGEDREPVPPGIVELGDKTRECLKTELGIDDAQLDELMETGKLEDLGAIVCLECQDNALRESEY